jgi:hypothetical protein
MWRLPHFKDSLPTDGAEVSLTRRPLFTRGKIPVTHFCYRLSRPESYSGTGSIRSVELIGNRTCDLPACSIVPQAIKLPRASTPSSFACEASVHYGRLW